MCIVVCLFVVVFFVVVCLCFLFCFVFCFLFLFVCFNLNAFHSLEPYPARRLSLPSVLSCHCRLS